MRDDERSPLTSIIDLLKQAIQNAREFRESLTPASFDNDLAPMPGDPAFERWRASLITGKVIP